MKQIYQQKETIRKEFSILIAYATMAFLAGLFLSSFDIYAHARFLESIGYVGLAKSYIISGLLGTVSTYTYTLFFRKIHIKPLNAIIATLILFSVSIYFIMSIVNPTRVIAILGMILLFPVNVFVVLTLWRFGRKLLFPRQSNKISPRIKQFHFLGFAAGAFLSSTFLYYFPLNSIAWFSLISLNLYWGSQFILYYVHYKGDIFHSGKEKFIPVKNNLFLFFTSRITTYLYLFTILSAIIGFSIHFTFINIASVGFQNVVGLSKFYGLFLSVTIAFIFIVDRFLIKRILYSYDSPYSLVLVPFIMFLAIIFSAIGQHFSSGFETYEHLTIFFLLIAIAKVGYESVKIIIQIPAQRSLFQILDIRYKQVVYPRIEGSIVMVGLMVSGIIILLITFIKSFNLNYVLYWTAFISILWIWSGIQLVRHYRKAQEKALGRLRYRRVNIESNTSFDEQIWNIITNEDVHKVTFALKILSEIQPILYEKQVLQLITNSKPENRKLARELILKDQLVSALPILKTAEEKAIGTDKKILIDVIQQLSGDIKVSSNPDTLRDIIYSGSTNEREHLAEKISLINPDLAGELLLELSKDIEPSVQNAAIKSLAKIKSSGFNYSLIDFLYPDKFNAYAFDAIASSGDDAIDSLERETILPNTPRIVIARIAKLYGKIGTDKSISIILSNLSSSDHYVMMHNLQALIDIRFQANQKNKYKLLNIIIKHVGIITQNFNYYKIIYKNAKYNLLSEAYREEIDYNYKLLFKLLSLIYNPNIITSLQELFLEGSHSQVNHAFEIADQYIDEDLKPVIFPLFENASLEERLKKLEYYYVQPKLKITDILRITLTHDFNTLSLYPRACAMLHIYENSLLGYEDEIIFNAYHKERLLSETALFILSRKYPDLLNRIIDDRKYDHNLELLINSICYLKKEELFFYRFKKLKEYPIFNDLSEYIALQLAHNAGYAAITKGEPFNVSSLGEIHGLLLTEPQVFKGDNNCVISLTENFININLLKEYNINEITSSNDTEIWLFPDDVIKELICDHIDFANAIFKSIEKNKIEYIINE